MNRLLPFPRSTRCSLFELDVIEAGYVAEPFLVPGDSGLMVNYAQGVEVAPQFSTGFGYDDAAKWLEKDHWILTLDVQQYNDTGDLGGDMGVVNSPQEISNPAGLYLGEVSVTRDPGNGWLYLNSAPSQWMPTSFLQKLQAITPMRPLTTNTMFPWTSFRLVQ